MMKMVGVFLVACCALFFFGTTSAEMYKWVDKNGVVHFSDTPVSTEETAAGVETLKSVGTTGGTNVFSDEWFDADEILQRSLEAAKAFLEQHENWPVTPTFSKFTTTYAGQRTAGIGFNAKIPEVMQKGSDPAYKYQRVKVMREVDPENPRRYRITNVELAGKVHPLK